MSASALELASSALSAEPAAIGTAESAIEPSMRNGPLFIVLSFPCVTESVILGIRERTGTGGPRMLRPAEPRTGFFSSATSPSIARDVTLHCSVRAAARFWAGFEQRGPSQGNQSLVERADQPARNFAKLPRNAARESTQHAVVQRQSAARSRGDCYLVRASVSA